MTVKGNARFWYIMLGVILTVAFLFTLQQVSAKEAGDDGAAAVPNLVSTGDQQVDATLQSKQIFFSEPQSEKAYITEDEAIEKAKAHRTDLAKKAESATAQFVLYTNKVDGTDNRPIWLVTLDGAVVEARGPKGTEQKEPNYPNKKTLIYIDASTGDVVRLSSLGYK